MQRVTTPIPGRNPPHFSQQARPWRPRTPTPAGEHYLRPIVADRVKRALPTSHVHGLLQRHLSEAKLALPVGRRGAVVLGRATAERILDAFKLDLGSRCPRSFAGGAVAFCAALGIHVGVDAAGAAVRLVAAVTPILERSGRFMWSADLAALKACTPDDPAILEVQGWLSRRPEQRASAVTSEPSQPSRESEPDRSRSKEHAHAVVALEHDSGPGAPSTAPAAYGLGCASPAPAEEAGPCPATPPARAGDAPMRPMTESGWQQAVPARLHCQRLLSLLVGWGGEPLLGSAREVVDRLAGQDGRWTSRLDRWGLLRALLTFERRRLIVRTADGWALPAFAEHEVLDMLDMRARPSPTRPTRPQERAIERHGIDPAGLSRGEARVVTYVLRKRADAGMMSYRQIEAIGAVMGQRPAEVSRVVVRGRSVDFEVMMGLVRSAPHDHGAIHG